MAKAKSKKKCDYDWRVPVTFGNWSPGQRRIGIGVRIPDPVQDSATGSKLTRPQFWQNFVQKVLKVGIEADPNADDDAAGQAKLIDDISLAIDTQAEVTGFSAHKGHITIRLVFTRGDVDITVLDRFIGLQGSLEWTVKGDLKERPRGRPRSTDADTTADDGDDEEAEGAAELPDLP